jgi:hypothetical protein
MNDKEQQMHMQIKSEYTKNQVEFFSKAKELFPNQASFSRKQLLQVKDALGYSVIPVWITGDAARKVHRGMYSLPECTVELTSLPVTDDTRGAPRKSQSAQSLTTASNSAQS